MNSDGIWKACYDGNIEKVKQLLTEKLSLLKAQDEVFFFFLLYLSALLSCLLEFFQEWIWDLFMEIRENFKRRS